MTERDYAEKLAAAILLIVDSSPRFGASFAEVADLIERERAEAREQERERVSARHMYAQDMVLRQANISQAWQEGTYRELERDLRAKLERAEAAAAQMRAALESALDVGVADRLYEGTVRRLGEVVGYGVIMREASRQWAAGPAGDGAFVAGPCIGTVRLALASDVGAGYVSPEQHARAVAEARRLALESACAWLDDVGFIGAARNLRYALLSGGVK